ESTSDSFGFYPGGLDEFSVYPSALNAISLHDHYRTGREPPSFPTRRSSDLYAGAVLADSPAGYWRLGESSGTTATDQTGTNAGTYGGGQACSPAGALSRVPDTSVVLDGSSGTVQIPNAAALDPTTQITLEAW